MVDFSKIVLDPAATQARWDEINRKEDQKIADLCSIEEGLSEWEVNFVESIANQYARQSCLTDRQRMMVDKILEENDV